MRIKRSVCPYVHLIITYFYLIEKRIYPKHIKSASVVIVDLKTSNTISLFVLLKKVHSLSRNSDAFKSNFISEQTGSVICRQAVVRKRTQRRNLFPTFCIMITLIDIRRGAKLT